ncbi:MAG: hypothetical protein Kow001_21960 [Acidobacteriota bacterium]
MKKAVLCLSAVSLFVFGPVWAETLVKRFEVSAGGLLTVKAERSSIEVSPAAGGTAEIEIISSLSPDELEQNYAIDVRQSGNQILVEVDYRRDFGGWFGGWGGGRGLKIVAKVPREFNVDLETTGGGIKVQELVGEVRAETSGGGISLGRIQGPVRAETSGGSIELTAASGSARLHTSGGGITLGHVEGEVDAETSGGSIRVEHASGPVRLETSGGGITVRDVAGPIDASTSGGSIQVSISRQPDADCRLATSGGGVEVRLAPGLGFELDAETSGGRVRATYPGAPGEGGKSRLAGKVNAGGPRLVLRTSGGSISVEPL